MIDIQTESGFWDWTHGPDKKEAKKKLNALFRDVLKGGHRESLRSLVSELSDTAKRKKFLRTRRCKGLRKVHPRAFVLLAQYGTNFTPIRMKAKFGAEPIPNACFGNSWYMMHVANAHKQRKLVACYVEGIAMGVMAKPMLHAWNTGPNASGKAWDWTLYASAPRRRYYGITLTERQHRHAMMLCYKKRGLLGPLLNEKNFPRVEKYLQKILKKRKTKAAAC